MTWCLIESPVQYELRPETLYWAAHGARQACIICFMTCLLGGLLQSCALCSSPLHQQVTGAWTCDVLSPCSCHTCNEACPDLSAQPRARQVIDICAQAHAWREVAQRHAVRLLELRVRDRLCMRTWLHVQVLTMVENMPRNAPDQVACIVSCLSACMS